MKQTDLQAIRQRLSLGLCAVGAIVTTSCALPTKEGWAQVTTRGLIPVLIEAQSRQHSLLASEQRSNAMPSTERVVNVQAVTSAEVVTTPSANAVPGKPGYVYSPHVTPKRIVDVRDFKPGEEARCPYTLQAFIVPVSRASSIASAPRSRPSVQVVSRDGGFKPRPKLQPKKSASDLPKHQPISEDRKEPAESESASIPYGTRVGGRPGFVYSPFATKKQLVDIVGIAPGVEVKCPYSNKLFRVPEPIDHDEIVPPLPSNPVPAPAPTPETAPSAPSPTPPPVSVPETPAAPTPPEPTPTAPAPQASAAGQ